MCELALQQHLAWKSTRLRASENPQCKYDVCETPTYFIAAVITLKYGDNPGQTAHSTRPLMKAGKVYEQVQCFAFIFFCIWLAYKTCFGTYKLACRFIPRAKNTSENFCNIVALAGFKIDLF